MVTCTPVGLRVISHIQVKKGGRDDQCREEELGKPHSFSTAPYNGVTDSGKGEDHTLDRLPVH